MNKCPVCNSEKSKIQPASGTHCWTTNFQCGSVVVERSGFEAEGAELANNCPHQTYKNYITIKDYIEKHSLDTPSPGSIEYSDMYVEIYNSIEDKITHKWKSVDANGEVINRAIHHYNAKELKIYFENN